VIHSKHYIKFIFFKNIKFSADNYVSKELFDEEKKRALDLNEEKLHLSNEIAKYDEKISFQKEMLKKEKALMNEQYDKMREQFENLANDILDKKSEKFVKINQSNMDQILKPLGENIDQFKKSIQEKYEKEIKERSSLEEQIKHLAELNQRISQDALNLTNALKGDSKARGDWGELQLEVLLEDSGLQKEPLIVILPSPPLPCYLP
jgi:DNA recombination protein RmuC